MIRIYNISFWEKIKIAKIRSRETRDGRCKVLLLAKTAKGDTGKNTSFVQLEAASITSAVVNIKFSNGVQGSEGIRKSLVAKDFRYVTASGFKPETF